MKNNKMKLEIILNNAKKNGYVYADPKFKLTRGTKTLIKETIQNNNTNDRYKLCESIADELENRFKGATLNYQLERMNLKTTLNILTAIDTYFLDKNKKKFYNDY